MIFVMNDNSKDITTVHDALLYKELAKKNFYISKYKNNFSCTASGLVITANIGHGSIWGRTFMTDAVEKVTAPANFVGYVVWRYDKSNIGNEVKLLCVPTLFDNNLNETGVESDLPLYRISSTATAVTLGTDLREYKEDILDMLLKLTTKVNSGQNWKLTSDDGDTKSRVNGGDFLSLDTGYHYVYGNSVNGPIPEANVYVQVLKLPSIERALYHCFDINTNLVYYGEWFKGMTTITWYVQSSDANSYGKYLKPQGSSFGQVDANARTLSTVLSSIIHVWGNLVNFPVEFGKTGTIMNHPYSEFQISQLYHQHMSNDLYISSKYGDIWRDWERLLKVSEAYYKWLKPDGDVKTSGVTDVNNIKTPGVYQVVGTEVNLPVTSSGHLTVTKSTTGQVLQTFHISTANYFYNRGTTNDGSSWRLWRRSVKADDFSREPIWEGATAEGIPFTTQYGFVNDYIELIIDVEDTSLPISGKRDNQTDLWYCFGVQTISTTKVQFVDVKLQVVSATQLKVLHCRDNQYDFTAQKMTQYSRRILKVEGIGKMKN